MIVSFRCGDTERLHQGWSCARFRNIETPARARLARLNAATSLRDLAAIPGNRLEALKGSRTGQHSIRINDQWRICFVWKDGHALETEIVDYH
jgi:toxin HigB-1